MFRLITRSPCSRTSSTARSISPPIREPARTSARARGKPRHRAHRVGQRLLAHQRDGVYRDVLSTDIVTVRFRNGADGHLPHLRAPPMMMIRFP